MIEAVGISERFAAPIEGGKPRCGADSDFPCKSKLLCGAPRFLGVYGRQMTLLGFNLPSTIEKSKNPRKYR